MRSWGYSVGKLRMKLGKDDVVIRTQSLYTYFVRSLWVMITVFTRLFQYLCTQILDSFISVSLVLFPTTHSPYYNVYSFYSKKFINNKGASA